MNLKHLTRMGVTSIIALFFGAAAHAAPPTKGDFLYLGYGGANNIAMTIQKVTPTAWDVKPRDFPFDPPAGAGVANFAQEHDCSSTEQVSYTWTGKENDEAPELRIAVRFSGCNSFGEGRKREWTIALYDAETGAHILRANKSQALVMKGVQLDVDPTRVADLPGADLTVEVTTLGD